MLSKNSLQPKHPSLKTAGLWCVLMLLLPVISKAGNFYCQYPACDNNDPYCLPAPESPESARMLLLTENVSSAVVEYARLVAADSANLSLNAEYAYALALNGIYDAALIRLDRIRSRNNSNKDAGYMTSQVFLLLGQNQLAGEFWKETDNTKAPAWIAAKASVLLQKFGRKKPLPASTNRDELIADFKRANRLAAQNALLRSLSLFDDITTRFPGEYLPYVGYSIALEHAGLLLKSAQALEAALSLAGNSEDDAETKQFLSQRLSAVRAKINTTNPQQASAEVPSKTAEKSSKPMMAYAGGMIHPDYVNFNLRYGYFISATGNLSANLGWTNNTEGLYSNLGILYYQRQKIFVAGLGLSGSFGNGSSAIYIKLSPGLSFMNKKNSASWDIFWDVQFPFSKKYATTVGFSIGRSFYFGNR